MNHEFIPYEEALALKELGFDEPCLSLFHKDGLFVIQQTRNHNQFHGQVCSAPLYQQVFRWFREKYRLSGTPQYFTGGFYCYTINDMKDTKESNRLFTEFKTYKEAELACLRKLIEIVKHIKYEQTN